MHAHNHHHHDHHHAASGLHRTFIIAIILALGFAIIEVIGGLWSGSLALLSDAGHMASDAVALVIAGLAAWISVKPPSEKHSYGYGRAEVIAAWISSAGMLVLSLIVIVEAVRRISHPHPVNEIPVMFIATIGLIINLLIAFLLAKRERTLNIRAVLLHVFSDIIGTLAVLISGIVIYFTQWMIIDPVLSIVIGLLIAFSSINLLREAFTVLMEGVPQHLNFSQVLKTMTVHEGVNAIHDLHIWTLSSGKVALSAHVDINDLAKWEHVLASLQALLKNEYEIDHITLQPEATATECKPCHKT